ncbi:MAG: 16S rRNA (guanine(966)-N(2))-methyltransferase RsmD [Clostridia bacterium]|nr:16S rRNA (guanine(966)-N(2))-methyltransferase RsmD [Clostridia bacterium]
MKNKYLLRIISGKYRGKGIISPKDMTVRPTSARVKDSLFNILRTDLFGADFLDLFAGTGQMGLEAVSNGAKCVFADKDVRLVRENISQIGCEDASGIVSGDFEFVAKTLLNQGKKFDFVFADPPYENGYYERIITCTLPLLKENGTLILEHSSDMRLEESEGYAIKDQRAYGSRALTFVGGKQ